MDTLDPTRLVIVREAAYRHPAGTGGASWTCPTCRTEQPLAGASLLRVREVRDAHPDEYALIVCEACRARLRPRRRPPFRSHHRRLRPEDGTVRTAARTPADDA